MRIRLAAEIWLVCLAALAPRHSVCSSPVQQLHRVEGRIFFPIGQEPPASSLQVQRPCMSCCLRMRLVQNGKRQPCSHQPKSAVIASVLQNKQVMLTLDTGNQLRAYPHADGTFSVHGVPAGAHRLDSSAMGFSIPSVSHSACNARAICSRATQQQCTVFAISVLTRI